MRPFGPKQRVRKTRSDTRTCTTCSLVQTVQYSDVILSLLLGFPNGRTFHKSVDVTVTSKTYPLELFIFVRAVRKRRNFPSVYVKVTPKTYSLLLLVSLEGAQNRNFPLSIYVKVTRKTYPLLLFVFVRGTTKIQSWLSSQVRTKAKYVPPLQI